MSSRSRVAAGLLLTALIAGIAHGTDRLPALGARAVLHPPRRHVAAAPPASCERAAFAGADITLEGWRCRPSGIRRGALVYLHGIGDNRASGAGIVERFVARGFEVVVYDSRAHGESGGHACTYGFFEKRDLRRVIDRLEPGPVVLIGSSLGAAVALQAAAEDPRIRAIVAVETFSDLRTVVADRAPFFLTHATLARVFAAAERHGNFDVDEVSPVRAAANVTAPVLLVHGDADVHTPPAHSRRLLAALRGPKRLMIVPGAAHNGSVRGVVWPEIDRWIDQALAAPRD